MSSILARSLFVAVVALDSHAAAQCEGWLPNLPGTNFDGPVYAMTTWDADGNGPQQPWLVVAGDFTSTGAVDANSIAAWDGSTWREFGNGINGPVYALTTYNGELIAGGYFEIAGSAAVSNVARWRNVNGWRAVQAQALNGPVYALAERYGELWIGGDFSEQTQSLPFHRNLVRWNGASLHWVFGTVPDFITLTSQCNALISRQNFAGGVFVASDTYFAEAQIGYMGFPGQGQYPGHIPLNCFAERGNDVFAGGGQGGQILRYTGSIPSAWTVIGGGTGSVYALATAPNGKLLVGGAVSVWNWPFPQSPNCAVFNADSTWSPMGGGTDGPVLSMFAWNNVVYVGGAFQATGGGTGPYFARWADMASPVFTTHPLSQNGALEGAVTLTAAATVAIGTPTYSWRFNGQPVSNGPGGASRFGGIVSGATTPSLTITGLTPLDAGEFVCVVTNGCTPVLSNPATLYVTPTCDGDFNRDFALDGFDVEALELVVGGGPCP